MYYLFTILETLETDLKFLSKSRAAVDRYIQLIHDITKCESIRDKIELILNTIKSLFPVFQV